MNSTGTNTAFSTRRGGRTAFTVIELMTVVLIIMLLLTILSPTIGKVRTNIRSSRTRHTINLISSGCREYEADIGHYPLNAHGLVQALTGRDDADGQTGYGFRRVPRGKVYGPYGGTEKLNTRVKALDLPTFMDAFGEHIYYYRYDATTGFTGGLPDEPAALKDYLKGREGKLHRKDFVLISRGPNGEWDAYYEDGVWTDSRSHSNVVNNGQILASASGNATGVLLSDGPATVTNTGRIEAVASAGKAIGIAAYVDTRQL